MTLLFYIVAAARLKINSEFQKYKKISGPEAISEVQP
jgi:hypothetical protein